MKCKHCQRKVFSLHEGYCGPCKRNGFVNKEKPTEQSERVKILTQALQSEYGSWKWEAAMEKYSHLLNEHLGYHKLLELRERTHELDLELAQEQSKKNHEKK